MTDMWNKVERYITSLPDNVVLKNNNEYVTFNGEDNPLELYKVHNFFVNAIKSAPTEDFVGFLNRYLNEKAALVDCDQISSLSQQMNKLKLEVKVPLPLIIALRSAMQGKYHYNPDEASIVSVVLQNDDSVSTPLTTCKHLHSLEPFNQFLQYNKETQFEVQLKLRETVFIGEVTSIQAMIALVVVLQCLPEAWRKDFLWDAWLAVTIQLSLSKHSFSGHTKEIFPCQWMKQVFYAERLVSPDKVRCILFGQDPVSYTESIERKRKATGIAFHGVGNTNASIKNMDKKYHINCNDDCPLDYCRKGKLLVNMIRCICEGDKSVSNNSCRGAWIAYTLKLAYYFSQREKPIIMFCNFISALPKIYMPSCVDPNFSVQFPNNLDEKYLMRVPHPASHDAVETDRVEKKLDKLNEQ